jgi:predicted nucleotidyltransferase
MDNALLDLSGKIETPILDAIGAVSAEANRLGVPLVIVGAAARDFLLQYGAGLATGRATKDVDFGVLVDHWNQYEQLASLLVSSGEFTRDQKTQHRFVAASGVVLDLIPFGKIAGNQHAIYWPPEGTRRMSTDGFAEAFHSSLEVLLRKNPDLVVKVASLPGLSILKLIAWHDAYPERARDAGDFYLIMNNYMGAENLDRLRSDAKDLVGDPPLPLHVLGARLLGRDMAVIANPTTTAILARILQVETSADGPVRLLGDMRPSAGPSMQEDELLDLLRAVRKGFQERREDVA